MRDGNERARVLTKYGDGFKGIHGLHAWSVLCNILNTSC